MVKLSLRPNPMLSFPSFWEDEEFPFTTRSNNGVEMYETDNEVVVKTAVPGLKDSDVEVTFEDGVLRISGKSEEKEEEREKKKVVYSSQRTTVFNYTTTIPRAIDASKISAEMEHGVLTVTAPLASEAKPKRITVKAKGK